MGANLILAGHLHGGIMRIPFIGGIFSPDGTFFPKYSCGVYHEFGSVMIVSRGQGNVIINMRIFNRPELVVVT